MNPEVLQQLLAYRGIKPYETPCRVCYGFGVILYGSTSTWRGGIGGAAMTYGVCDKCWGSGVEARPWPSHKEFERLKKLETKTTA